jgi:hypothetical protein
MVPIISKEAEEESMDAVLVDADLVDVDLVVEDLHRETHIINNSQEDHLRLQILQLWLPDNLRDRSPGIFTQISLMNNRATMKVTTNKTTTADIGQYDALTRMGAVILQIKRT